MQGADRRRHPDGAPASCSATCHDRPSQRRLGRWSRSKGRSSQTCDALERAPSSATSSTARMPAMIDRATSLLDRAVRRRRPARHHGPVVELLGRARASRRRRRQLRTGGVLTGAAALTAVAVLAVPIVQGDAGKPADSDRRRRQRPTRRSSQRRRSCATPRSSVAVGAAASLACRVSPATSKLARSSAKKPAATSSGSEAGRYGEQPGDLRDPGDRAGAAGALVRPVAVDLSQPGRLAQLCSELRPALREPWVDLRAAERSPPTATDVTCRLRLGSDCTHARSRRPPGRRRHRGRHHRARRGLHRRPTTGSASKSIVGETATCSSVRASPIARRRSG